MGGGGVLASRDRHWQVLQALAGTAALAQLLLLLLLLTMSHLKQSHAHSSVKTTAARMSLRASSSDRSLLYSTFRPASRNRGGVSTVCCSELGKGACKLAAEGMKD